MEWILLKEPSEKISDSLTIDHDNDDLKSEEGLILLLQFYEKCNDKMKSVIFKDLYILLKWNENNIKFIWGQKRFFFWIL
jgi:hypothetical protein